ncbi:MAG: RNA-binding S4 domain-containing protein [Pseudoflavonifractor sp.]|nr:RNA-binding S4 domain-containing protein [Alloprevotella sp.]MCM1117413.1 RNA-binding S4 domain-containing protein [Pseudoflavonifractor sp.]
MENNQNPNDKKSKRPRIGERPIIVSDATENQGATSADQQSYQPRPYQQRPYQPRYGQGGYQPRYNQGQGGFQPRYNQGQGGYQPRPYQPRHDHDAAQSDVSSSPATDSAQTSTDGQQGGYKPRYNQGGYKPRYNQGQQGGYQPRYNQGQSHEGGYQPRYNQSQGHEGGYKPRYNQGQGHEGGYKPRYIQGQGHEGGYKPRYNQGQGSPQQGGYKPRYNQGGPQQGGYKPRYNQQGGRPGGPQQHPQTNRFGMPKGGKSFVPRPKPVEYEQPVCDPNEQIRLNKYMANAGICSRREADEFIQQGLVKVNGNVVTELGTKITCNDVVEYDEKVVTLERKTYILLNKPKDCVTTSDDPNGRTTVLDLVKGACKERIYPVGRLDRNTTGVLLLTNDGDLASKLTHPKYIKKKIYHVWTDKDISEDDMQAIADGIELDDGPIHADAISYATETDRNQAGIEIHSGRNRIVRRIFEKLGYRVTKLDRVYFAGLTKKNLPRGRWRYLTQEEVNFLKMGTFE